MSEPDETPQGQDVTVNAGLAAGAGEVQPPAEEDAGDENPEG